MCNLLLAAQSIILVLACIFIVMVIKEVNRIKKRISSLEIEFENCRLNAKFIATQLMKFEKRA